MLSAQTNHSILDPYLSFPEEKHGQTQINRCQCPHIQVPKPRFLTHLLYAQIILRNLGSRHISHGTANSQHQRYTHPLYSIHKPNHLILPSLWGHYLVRELHQILPTLMPYESPNECCRRQILTGFNLKRTQ